MSAIKITPADSAFSKCVRYRAGWACERCGAQHDSSSTGLHCSHFFGRANWSVRFHPDNARSLCHGCHSWLSGNPYEHCEWIKGQIGEGRLQMLLEARNDTSLGKLYRKTKGKGDIAKWFRDQLAAMQSDFTLKDFEAWL